MHGVAATLLVWLWSGRSAGSSSTARTRLRSASPRRSVGLLKAALVAGGLLAALPASAQETGGTPPAAPASAPAAAPGAAAVPAPAATPAPATSPAATSAAVATPAAATTPATTPSLLPAASPESTSAASPVAISTTVAPSAATSTAEAAITTLVFPGTNVPTAPPGGGFLGFLYSLFIFGLVVGLPLIPYWYVQTELRMNEHGWKAYLLGLTVMMALAILASKRPTLGVDLQGGVNLVYGLKEEKTGPSTLEGTMLRDTATMDKMIGSLKRRIDPAGVQEIVIRRFGERQIEIIMPGKNASEASRVKEKLAKTGSLLMRVLANSGVDANEVRRAFAETSKGTRKVFSGDRLVAEWVPLAIDPVTKQPREAELLSNASCPSRINPLTNRAEVLVKVDPPEAEVKGDFLRNASVGTDENGRPQVSFNFNEAGAERMDRLTGSNLPKSGVERLLCVILDGELFNAATIRGRIRDSGRITGDRFTVDEVTDIVDVLNAGSLPVSLNTIPQMEMVTSATLGDESVKWGSISIVVSFLTVLAFMGWFYRFAGYVAIFAMLLNLLYVVALMVQINAAFTLPGLAGLVLTVGMAVDANVLIFERMREELERKATLRMAIRNGYQRAFSTIVDSNLTTLITATVMYAIGSDQIKGFAVSLWLGIAISMFSAIFATRLIFDVCERQRWITTLSMHKLLDKTHFDFLSVWKPATMVSVVIVAIGLVGLIGRGKGILDIDFLGGSTVQMRFEKPQEYAQIRTKVDSAKDELPDSLVKSLRDSEAEGGGKRTFIVDTSKDKIDEVKATLGKLFAGELAHNSLTFTDPVAAAATAPAATAATTSAAATATASPEAATTAAPAAAATSAAKPDEKPAPLEPKSEEKPKTETKPEEKPKAEEKPAPAEPKAEPKPEEKPAPAAEPKAEAKPEPKAEEKPKTEEKPAESKEKTSFVAPATLGLFPAPLSGWLFYQETPAAATTAKPAETPAPATTPAVATPAAATTPAVSAATPASTTAAPATTAAAPSAETTAVAAPEAPLGGSRSDVTFAYALTQAEVVRLVEEVKKSAGINFAVDVSNAQFADGNDASFKEWTLVMNAPPAAAKTLLTALKAATDAQPYFPFANNIGGQVASKTQFIAFQSIFISFFFIILYIWFRFHRISYGIAAVVALVHDVLVMLAAVALSSYLAPVFGFLLVEPFKINLAIIAAFLTIMGYSLNDTIVIFDRIREIKGKSPDLTRTMINQSVNETLSRTILTSTTTLLVCIILYIAGVDSIKGFAFALLVGVVSGTYSTVFIACPVLIWLGEVTPEQVKAAVAGGSKSADREKKASV